MEDIKPTRVNYVSDGRSGRPTRRAATPTYHRELGCRQAEGGRGEGVECREERGGAQKRK